MCEHKTARFLDCQDCKDKGIICDEVICIDCGESVNQDIYVYDGNIFIKK